MTLRKTSCNTQDVDSGIYHWGWETDLPRFPEMGSFFLPGNDSLEIGKCGDEGVAARRQGENMGLGSPSSLEGLDATGYGSSRT